MASQVIRQELSERKESDFSNVFAPVFALLNYDAAMAMGIAACETNNAFFSASDWYEMMLRIKFNGTTGDFNDETGTRLLLHVRYTLRNLISYPDPTDERTIFLESIKSAVVDFNSLGIVGEIITPFVYAGNTTNQPPFLPFQDVNLHLIPNWALAVGLSFCGIMMLMLIGWGIWSIANRKHRMVHASQPFFLIMLCIGTFLIASLIIPTSFQEPMSDLALDIGCMLFPWLVCIGFVTAFSALFTKNGRINAVSLYYCLSTTCDIRHEHCL